MASPAQSHPTQAGAAPAHLVQAHPAPAHAQPAHEVGDLTNEFATSPFHDDGTPLHDVTFVVLDVETTGGSPRTASLTEIAAARYRGGELAGTFSTLVRPDGAIPPFITALTGISDAMVVGAPPVGAVLPRFLEFVGTSVVVGHNVTFDLGFLDGALVAGGWPPIDNLRVDTLLLARRLVRDEVPNCKLATLASVLGLAHQPSHRALSDVYATGDLLHALLERAGSYGIVDLGELLRLPRLTRHPEAAKLSLTTRLPRRPGVYWLTDVAGDVLYVGTAMNLRAGVRSLFADGHRSPVRQLLQRLHAVHHCVCLGASTTTTLQDRLVRASRPPFNALLTG